MREYKIGGKITLEDNKSYRIVEMIKLNGKNYLVCCTTEKPILPALFEKVEIDDRVFLRLEEDPNIIKTISLKMLRSEE